MDPIVSRSDQVYIQTVVSIDHQYKHPSVFHLLYGVFLLESQCHEYSQHDLLLIILYILELGKGTKSTFYRF